MADVATLGIAVKYDEVDKAAEALEGLGDAAAGAEKSIKRQEQAAGQARDEFGRFKKSADDANGALGKVKNSMFGATGAADLLKGALAGAAAAFSVKAIVGMADAWSDMQSRVGAAIGDMSRAGDVMQRLVDVANASYSPLAQTVEVYGRNVAILRQMGRSADEAADFTEALNHALVTTATKGQDADVVLNSLSRAISNGSLRSMEFETIMSRSPRVLEAVAEEMGTNVIGLLALAKEGKVTGDVITNSLINSLEKLRAEAGEMPATVGDAFVRIQTNVLATVGSFDQATGASGALAEALLFVADNMDRIITTAATAAVGFGTYYVGAMIASAVATGTLTGALRLLRAALAATGIGLIVIAAGELVYQLLQARQATESWGAAFQEVGRRLQSLFQAVQDAWNALVNGMTSAWYSSLRGIASGAETAMNKVRSIFGADPISFGDTLADLDRKVGDYAAYAKIYAEGAAEAFTDAFKKIETATAGGDLSTPPPIVGTGGGGGGAGGSGAGGAGAEDTAASRLQAELEQRLQTLREHFYTEQEMLAQQRLENLETLDLARQAEMLSQDEYNAYKLMVEEQFQNQMRQIKGKELANALGSTADFFGSMATLTEGGNKKMLAIQKAFSIAQALVNMYLAASQAMADWSTLTVAGKFAAVAAILAKGGALVASIKGVSSGGGGSSSSGGVGGGAAAPTAAPEQRPVNTQAVEIKLHGEVYSREAVAELMNKMNDLSSDGFKLVIGTS